MAQTRIVKISTKHPNADRLSLTKVDVGNEKLSIICGANNIENGQKVVIAKTGTKIKNTDQKTLEIKNGKLNLKKILDH